MKPFFVFFILFISFFQSIYGRSIGQSKFQKERSLCFIENKGQIRNQSGKLRNDILYQLRGNGINVFIDEVGLHYQFSKLIENNKEQTRRNSFAEHSFKSTATSIESYRIDVALLHANKDVEIIAEQPQTYYENYCTEQCHAVARAYSKITYKNIYPNIDWVLYIKDNKLEYDFVVHQGGHVQDIQIQYTGITGINLDTNGNITVICPMGSITERAPYGYELNTQKRVNTKYVLQDNVVRFETDNFNNTIVIDPAVQWGTYFGGSGDDLVAAIAPDGNGNMYITGETNSSSYIATSGAYHTTYAGSGDVFLAKFNASGVCYWATYYGGSALEYSDAIACDDAGYIYIYICGVTVSYTGIATAGTHRTSYSGSGQWDAYLAKFNSSGGLEWGSYYGGSKQNEGYGIACDNNGHVYITGRTNSPDSISTSGAYKTYYSGGLDVFLAQFSTSAGSLLWGTYFGSTGYDFCASVVCDGNRNVYMAGYTNSKDSIATPGAYQEKYAGDEDCFMTKFNSSGKIIWSTYYGGDSTEDMFNGLTFDKFGNYIYLAGSTDSKKNIASAGIYIDTVPPYYGYRRDLGYLAKFDTSGNRLWGTYILGGWPTATYNVSCDDIGCIYLAGTTNDSTSTGISSTGNSYYGGQYDLLVEKFSPTGQRLWGTYFGGSGIDDGCGMAGPGNYLYLYGSTSSTSSISTIGSYRPGYGGGGEDGFLVKLNTDTTVIIADRYTDTVICVGNSFNLNYLVNYPFASGNTFTAQLSDIHGSFSSPVIIGSVTATTSGSISCTIPSSTTLGTGYKIRIVASAPSFTSPDDGKNINIISGLDTPIIISNSPICVNDTLSLLASSHIKGVVFTWTGPGGYNATGSKQIIAHASTAYSGIYNITISATGCPSHSTNANIIVNPIVPASPTDSTNVPICLGQPLYLFGHCSTPGLITYKWVGPGYVSSLQNPVIPSAITSLSGKWKLTAYFNGCTSTDSFNLVVNPKIIPSVSINHTALHTSGDTVIFTAAVTGGGTSPSYQWKKNGVIVAGAITNPYTDNNVAIGDIITVVVYSNAVCAQPDSAVASTWPLGILASHQSEGDVEVFPVPATSFIIIQNAEEKDYLLTDVSGKILLRGVMHTHKQQIDISRIAQGIYLLQVQSPDGAKHIFKIVKE